MITTAMPPTGEASKGVHGQPSRTFAKIVIPAFLLAAVLSLAGSPAAMATSVFASADTAALSDPLPCRGDKPGVCPYYYSDQPGKQSNQQPDERRTSPGSSSPDGRGGTGTGGTGGYSEHQQQ
jgi:hypothetical protein